MQPCLHLYVGIWHVSRSFGAFIVRQDNLCGQNRAGEKHPVSGSGHPSPPPKGFEQEESYAYDICLGVEGENQVVGKLFKGEKV